MRSNLRRIDAAVDLAKQVTVRDMTLKAKANQQRVAAASDFFTKIDPLRPFKISPLRAENARKRP
jgi:hypothetical protein